MGGKSVSPFNVFDLRECEGRKELYAHSFNQTSSSSQRLYFSNKDCQREVFINSISHVILIAITHEERKVIVGWLDSTVGRTFTLHMAYPGLVPGTL